MINNFIALISHLKACHKTLSKHMPNLAPVTISAVWNLSDLMKLFSALISLIPVLVTNPSQNLVSTNNT